MYTVFLVGGIASGKSTLARLLQEKGAIRIDLDELSREVLAAGEPVLQSIATVFGEDLLDSTGALDRALLAQRAFADPESIEKLEAIELPLIKDALVKRLDECNANSDSTKSDNAKTNQTVCVVEIPRFDTMGALSGLADEVIAVYAPYNVRQERALAKGLSAADFSRRAALQMSDDQIAQCADVIIENYGPHSNLTKEAAAIMERASRSSALN